MVQPPEILLLYRIVLAILGFLLLYMKLNTILLRFLKNFAGILMGIALNLYIAFGKIAIFTTLILPTQEHGRSFHFSGVVFNFFLQRFKVLVIQVFHCLIRVTPRYFILFVAIVKGVVSLISSPAFYHLYTEGLLIFLS